MQGSCISEIKIYICFNLEIFTILGSQCLLETNLQDYKILEEIGSNDESIFMDCIVTLFCNHSIMNKVLCLNANWLLSKIALLNAGSGALWRVFFYANVISASHSDSHLTFLLGIF